MKKKVWLLWGIVCIVFMWSCLSGRYQLSLFDIAHIIAGTYENETGRNLFFNIRLSRTVLVFLCGGSLALSGMVFQTIFKNPLVSPDVLGVANGCSVGAAAAIVFTDSAPFKMQLYPFLTGMLVVIFAITLSNRVRGNRILSMIISGIIASSVASSSVMAIKYVADPNKHLPAIEYWLMGGFHNASWGDVKMILPLLLAAAAVLYLLRFPIKILTLGDDEAQMLGLNVGIVRNTALLCATLLVSTVVSVAGVVSWVGLIAPHIIRLFAGEDFTANFVSSFLCGGILLLFSDTLSRSLFSVELPISILTSLIGAVFLLAILSKRGGVPS